MAPPETKQPQYLLICILVEESQCDSHVVISAFVLLVAVASKSVQDSDEVCEDPNRDEVGNTQMNTVIIY